MGLYTVTLSRWHRPASIILDGDLHYGAADVIRGQRPVPAADQRLEAGLGRRPDLRIRAAEGAPRQRPTSCHIYPLFYWGRDPSCFCV
jgi:hypothetical protein